MNAVNLVGRFVRDPEIKYTQDGKAIANFSLAIRKTKDEALFMDCTAFKAVAEVLGKYGKKGDNIAVCGRLDVDEYTNRDGVKVKKTYVIVDRITLLGQKNEQ